MDINFIIEILVVSFLSIFLLINWKIIKIKLMRFVFGRYSYTYVNYHKNQYRKNPYPPCINDELVNHCFNFVNRNPEKKLYFTKTEISFGVFPFYSKFATVKRNVIPNCFNNFKISDNKFVKSAGFRKEIPGAENKEIYFFLNNIFFMGELMFDDVSKSNNDKLIGILSAKYNIPGLTENESFYIQDENNSLIYFENNGFSISIQYVNLRERYINEIWDSYFKNAVKKDILVATTDAQEIFSIL